MRQPTRRGPAECRRSGHEFRHPAPVRPEIARPSVADIVSALPITTRSSPSASVPAPSAICQEQAQVRFLARAAPGRFPAVPAGPRSRAGQPCPERSPASPAISMRTSITSRVVPAISEVIAASRPASWFRSVDLPAFGARRRWQLRTHRGCARRPQPRPLRGRDRPSARRSAPSTSGETSTGTSSSAKSIVASSRAPARIRSRRHPSTFCPTEPGQHPHRLPPLRLGLGVDQVGQAFDLRQVQARRSPARGG
jgi:hypothetical protein